MFVLQPKSHSLNVLYLVLDEQVLEAVVTDRPTSDRTLWRHHPGGHHADRTQLIKRGVDVTHVPLAAQFLDGQALSAVRPQDGQEIAHGPVDLHLPNPITAR